MSRVAYPGGDNRGEGADAGLVSFSLVLFFLALAASDLVPGLNPARAWAISGALTITPSFPLPGRWGEMVSVRSATACGSSCGAHWAAP